MSLENVAARESRLETLRELRAYLARALDECISARDQAALSARFTDVLAQIDELKTDDEEDGDDFGSLLVLPGGAG